MPADGENLKTAYEEVCRAHHGIADFRAKLLALLPITSGAGWFLLLAPEKSPDPAHLPAVGLFGGAATLALFIYELRGIQRCNALRQCGKKLEEKLLGNARGLGAFTGVAEGDGLPALSGGQRPEHEQRSHDHA